MAINTDKNTYTVIFAMIMVVVVGSVLAFLASGLSDKIKENERFEKQQNILKLFMYYQCMVRVYGMPFGATYLWIRT